MTRETIIQGGIIRQLFTGSDQSDLYIARSSGILLSLFDTGLGDDIIYGDNNLGVGISRSLIFSGDGADTIVAGGRTKGMVGTSIFAGSGNDNITSIGEKEAAVEDVYIDGEDGDDTFEINDGTGTVIGGNGTDRLILFGDSSDFNFIGQNGQGNIVGTFSTVSRDFSTDLSVDGIETFQFNDGQFSYEELFGGGSGPAPGSIGDFVWNDLNGNGFQDAGEPGIKGVLVNLLDVDQGSAIGTYTDADGFYKFSDLPTEREYQVFFSLSNTGGFKPTIFQADGGLSSEIDSDVQSTVDIRLGLESPPFVLNSGENNLSIDAGFISISTQSSIGDFVWSDLNADGFQDTDEPGIEGVEVRLRDVTNGQTINTVFTDASGFYSFEDLTPNTDYQVVFFEPDGFEPTIFQADGGVNFEIDSDAEPILSGIQASPVFTLGEGENNSSIDAGYIPDDAPPQLPEVSIEATDANKEEGNSGRTEFTFTVNRTGNTSQEATVTWTAAPTFTNPADVNDFVPGTEFTDQITFRIGEDSKTITLNVQGDTDFEEDEGFTVTLSKPDNASLGEATTATGTIVNDDSEAEQGVIVIQREITAEQYEGTELSDSYTATKGGIIFSSFDTKEGSDSITAFVESTNTTNSSGTAINSTLIKTGDNNDTIDAQSERNDGIGSSEIETGDGDDTIYAKGVNYGISGGSIKTGIGADGIIAEGSETSILNADLDGGDGNDTFELRNERGKAGTGTINGNFGDEDRLTGLRQKHRFKKG